MQPMQPMNPMQQGSQDFMAPERMGMFVASLAGLPQEEVRKAKLLYIRNAISQYNATLESMSAFGSMQGCFFLIPLFWPMLSAQRRMMNAGKRLAEERILNAIEVWRDDLRGETFQFGEQRITC